MNIFVLDEDFEKNAKFHCDKHVVTAYRNYYIGEKQHIASWKNRKAPDWFALDS